MRKLLKLSVLVGVIALGTGCQSNNFGVAAKSPSLNAYETSIGSVNTPAFELGDVVALDPNTHKAQRVATVQINPTDVAYSQPSDKTSEKFDASFQLTFPQGTPAFTRSEVSDAVEAQTVLSAENWSTRGLKNPAAFATGSAQLATAVTRWHQQNPDAKFFLVSAVAGADKVYLSYSGSDPIKVSKYEFHVYYPQNDQLDKLAKSSPAFFKATPLTVVQDKRGHETVAVDKNFTEKLGDYQIPVTDRPPSNDSEMASGF